MTITQFILLCSAVWFILSIVAAVLVGRIFKIGLGDDVGIYAAPKGDLSDYVRSLNREAAE